MFVRRHAAYSLHFAHARGKGLPFRLYVVLQTGLFPESVQSSSVRKGGACTGCRSRSPREYSDRTFDRLVDSGYALRTGDQLWLAQAGVRQVDAVLSVGRADRRQAGPLTNIRGASGPRQVEAALERITTGYWFSAIGTTTALN